MSANLNFSVVMSTRNRGALIEPTLRSLMALDHPALEIVVVDQSSDDVTGDVLLVCPRSHAQEIKRLVALLKEKGLTAYL